MRPKRAVLTVASTIFLGILASNFPSPLYVVYQQRFHFSTLVVTAIFATYALGVLVALVGVGRISDLLGRHRVLLPAMGLLVVSTVLFACARDVAWLYLARFVAGLATGAITPAATAALVELDASRRGRGGSLTSALSFVFGAAAGTLLAGVLAQYLPDPTVVPFLVETVLDVAGAIAVATLPASALAPGSGGRWRLQRPSVPRSVRGPFALAGAVVVVGWSIGSLYGSLSPSMVRDLLHLDSDLAAGAVLCVFNTVSGVAQLLSRRVPARRTMQAGVTITLVGLASTELAFSAGSAALYLAATVVLGAGNGLAFAGSLLLVNEVAPSARRAELNTAYNLVAYGALSVPAVGVGLLGAAAGLHTASLVFAVAVGALAIGVWVPLARGVARAGSGAAALLGASASPDGGSGPLL